MCVVVCVFVVAVLFACVMLYAVLFAFVIITVIVVVYVVVLVFVMMCVRGGTHACVHIDRRCVCMRTYMSVVGVGGVRVFVYVRSYHCVGVGV